MKADASRSNVAASGPSTPAKTPETPEEPAPVSTKPTAQPKAKQLAILQGAANLELKPIAEQIAFTSDKNYKVLAAELMKKLDADGWKKDGPELVGVSAILTRTQGEASLTIFVKPAGTGSTVSIHAEGLDWEE